ncbi:MAG: chlorite dismutase family protein [Thermoplasmata archaeon]
MSDASEPASAVEEGGPRDFVKYTFYHLDPAWRRLPADVRRAGREALARVLAPAPGAVLVRTYSLVGTRAETEFCLWMIDPDLARIQELHARVAGSPLGGYLEVAFSYLGMARRSEYLGEHTHPGSESGTRRRPLDRPFLFVYPFIKKREWYSVPFDERRRIMGEHFRIGHKYPDVQIHTGYSFGLDDMEFILAFEADAPADFLDLVSDLRPTESSRYTQLETPIFTCLRVEPARMLELAEGLP